KNEAAPPPEKKDPEVTVAVPLVRTVTDFEIFTGHTESEKFVNIRARVSGVLEKVDFIDGVIVEKGQRLCLIDPRPFEAAFKDARAAVAEARSRVERIRFDWEQERRLLDTGGAGSQEKARQLVLDLNVAQSNVGSAEARLDTAKLNLEWTAVCAPF